MRKKKKKETIEEYHTGKTQDLRNVIAEIQKVDQETADLSSVVAEAQRIDRKTYSSDKREVLVTCRVLFYSIIDKILLLILLLGFLGITYINFRGSIFSATYGFWFRVLKEIGIILCTGIVSLLFNWIYQCYVKTMLCVTPHSIYRECYFPFFKKETSIPLKHVTNVTTINFLWIFRMVIIFQYHHLPLVFYTWNNEKFKSRVDELLGNEQNISNGYMNKSLFQRSYIPIIQWIGVILFFILFVLGIVHLFGYLLSPEKQVSGVYLKGNQKITLKVNGKCDLKISRIKNLKKCTWKINNDQTITIRYEFSKSNYYGEEYDTKDTMKVGYKEDVLIYNSIEYNKK